MTFRNLLHESSLSRIWKLTQEHDSGTISAFRGFENCGDGAKISHEDNMKNSRVLKAKLLKLGYSVTKVQGTYIENYGSDNEIEVHEDSFLVIDIKDDKKLKKNLMILGELYDQDSITFQSDGVYELVGTNKCPNGYPGYHKTVKLGKTMFGKKGEFHSKINNRPFVFETFYGTQTLKDFSLSEIRSISELSKY